MQPLLRSVSRLTLTARRTKNIFSYPHHLSGRHLSPLTRRSITNAALKPASDTDAIAPVERQLPEHAVISTFDLFSIGGPFDLRTRSDALILSTRSRPLLFSHCWAYACCQDIYYRFTRATLVRESMANHC